MIVIYVAMLFASHAVAAESPLEEQIRVADSLVKARNYDSAIVLYTAALPLFETEYGHNDSATGKLLYKLGTTRYRKGDHAAAEPILLRTLHIYEKMFPEHHPKIGGTLNALGIVTKRLGRYDEAEAYLKRSLEVKEASLGKDSPKLASSLTNLAELYRVQARYSEAEKLVLRALYIREKHLEASDPKIALTLRILGDLYIWMGRYQQSLTYLNRALKIQSTALGRDHPRLAYTINSLANAYRRLGFYDQEDSLYNEALRIWEQNDHPDAYLARLNLANAKFKQGHYREAEPMLRQTIREMKTRLGEEHSQVAYATSQLGNVYWELRRLEEAEEKYLEAIEISKKALGGDHPEVAFSLRSLGVLYTTMNRYAEAEPLLQRALDIRSRALGMGHLRVALTVEALAALYLYQERLVEADSLLMSAISNVEQEYGPDHPVLVELLEIHANVHLKQSRFEDGLSLTERSLQLCRKSCGATHQLIAKNLLTMSNLQRGLGNWVSAVNSAEDALRIRRDGFNANMVILSERDALLFASRMRASVDNYFSCLHDATTTAEGSFIGKTEGVNQLLASKGAVSDGLFERRQALAEEPDSTIQSLSGEYRQARAALSDLHVAGPQDLTEEKYASRLDSLSRHARELEAELSLRSASFRSRAGQQEPTAAQLSELIPVGSALLEYLRYSYQEVVTDAETTRYLVAVVKKGQEPILVDLGEAAQIERQVQKYRRHMLNVVASGRPATILDQQDYQKIARNLYRSVIEPVTEYVKECELILVAPDGALNMVAFAGLVDDVGKYLIERCAVHYLLSGRDIVRLQTPPVEVSGLLAIGDPDYEASAATRQAAFGGMESNSSTTTDSSVAEDSTRFRSGSTSLADIIGTPLPASRDEVLTAAKSFSDRFDEEAEVSLAAGASEDLLRIHAGGKRVIHLATHGFFLQGGQLAVGYESGHAGFDVAGENPLLLSGLLFAGANLHGEGAAEAGLEDGILTAEEVASLDLAGTRLVVLSACETGLGEIEQGEGVYGLRRAFQIAGARTIISALWPVSDVITAGTMGSLYHGEGESLPAKLRNIQIESIAALRNNKKADHPSSWGAFVALGDWR